MRYLILNVGESSKVDRTQLFGFGGLEIRTCGDDGFIDRQ